MKINFTRICLFVSICIFLYCSILTVKLVLIEEPLEYRENAITLTTHLLLEGQNPYNLDNQPVYTNVYGILFHFIVYPFARLFGISFFIHRFIAVNFMLYSCIIVYFILRWMSVSRSIALVAFAFFFYHLTRAGHYLGGPNNLGLFLFLCSITVPWKYRYSNSSLLLSIALSILALLTKPYFVIGFPCVVIYVFLFISKRRGIIFSLFFILLLALTVWIVSRFFECYFINTFYANYNIATENLSHLRRQIKDYFYNTFAFVIIAALSFLLAAVSRLKNWFRSGGKQGLLVVFNGINITNFAKPLLCVRFELMSFVLLTNATIILFKMGLHTGAFFGYFAQLITPFLFEIYDPMLIVAKTNRIAEGIFKGCERQACSGNRKRLLVDSDRLQGNLS